MEIKSKQEQLYSYQTKQTLTSKLLGDKDGHYAVIKGPFQQEDVTIVKEHAPNARVPSFIKQMLIDLKDHINSKTMGEFNNPLSSMGR